MKKYIILAVILILGFSSCEDYLNLQPLDQPSSETFLSTEPEVVMGVNACYNYLDANEDWSQHSWYRWLIDFEDAGQIRMSNKFGNFRDGNVDPLQGNVGNFYRDFYRGVARCHIVIDGMEKAKEVMDLDKWNALRAEAQVIRAWCYYNLVVKFGDIPFTTTQLEMTEYANLERSPEDEVYAFIMSEIEEAAQFLPATRTGDESGRVTSGTAYAIGAKAALYRAFFHDGQAISPDASYLGKVKEYTQKIIDSGAHQLFYDQSDIKNSYKNLFLYPGENSKEVILQKEFNFGAGRSQDMNISIASRNYPNGFAATTPQEYLIHAYEDTLGNTVDQSSYYDPKNPFAGREPRFYQTIVYPRVEGDQDIEITLNTESGPKVLKGYNEVFPGSMYPDARDPNLTREYKTLLKAWADPVGKDLDNYDWYTDANGIDHVFGNQDGTNSYSSRTGYLTWKYWTISDWATDNQQSSSLNFILIRYADVLLMNAEARIELNDDLNKATEYINRVRARGWGMSYDEYTSHPSAVSALLGQGGLRAKVRRERKIELCFEGTRYEDLKRYGVALEALTMDVVGRPKFFHLEADTNIPQVDENGVVHLPWLEGLNGQEDSYPNRWWKASNYRDYYNRWPIPQSEFDNGKALTEADQNPGYLGS
ncbi:RagB/SusD family nutrient uptake outer membrane protein [uncultured Draconibacterium sp.]|uniref:RagB/SusD family nutrient uptake outer membrane protein n=1 Tax=uncultured Draconibacterium sp. TaxID=1573823 RepID=UPI0029C98599|nr:RagB/SusD family nutrient uptake outer membrane protein [uncultured Draconibacterium sp.]